MKTKGLLRANNPFPANKAMIVDEHVTIYLHSLEKEGSPLLEEIRAYAEETKVPVIRREMESFLRVLLSLVKPERILEIGTGIAFSSIFMAENCASVREIVTLENYPPRIEEAKKNLERWNREGQKKAKIRLLPEDAAETVRNLKGSFDLIFLDGPKGQYMKMLPELYRLLRAGGVLLADNVLQEGELVRPRYVTQRRERTIHERMREFLWTISHDPSFETTVLSVGDGVSISIRKE